MLYLAHGALSGSIALVLWRHPGFSMRASLACFIALVLPLLPLFWIIQSRAVADGALWQPFIGRKMLVLGLALLTPMVPIAPLGLLALFLFEWMPGRADRTHSVMARSTRFLDP